MKTTKGHIKYWKDRELDWKTQYFDTHGHPHRELLMRTMARFRFGSVFEVGCASGPNLVRIHYGFPHVQFGGCDVSEDAIKFAKDAFPKAFLNVSPAHDIFLSDKSVDMVISDACLIYVGRNMINKTLQEIKRVTRRNIVFCEFHSDSLYQRTRLQLESGYYAYNWKKLLEKNGFFNIEMRKIPKEVWPGTPWEEFGFIISASI